MSDPIREFQATWWDFKAVMRSDFPPYRCVLATVRWLARVLKDTP